jgi:phosphoribosylanthranilate isomerase
LIWVKICGTTSLDDARVAVEAGADALGFIFAPSPRRISPRDAKKIIAELPKEIEKVGVFVNQKPEIILDTVRTAGLTGVQLHGDEDEHVARALRKRASHVPLYKAIPAKWIGQLLKNGGFLGLQQGSENIFQAMVLDSGSPENRGGTGKTFDWDDAAPLVSSLAKRWKIVIAGGLGVSNVLEAIQLFHPWGVDVVSGVEKEPGKKDHDKVRAFVKAAKAAQS